MIDCIGECIFVINKIVNCKVNAATNEIKRKKKKDIWIYVGRVFREVFEKSEEFELEN